MANRWTLAGGAGLGAGVMYLLDPDKGRRRRALTRDKVLHFANKAGEAIGTTSTDLSHRTAGTFAKAPSISAIAHGSKASTASTIEPCSAGGR